MLPSIYLIFSEDSRFAMHSETMHSEQLIGPLSISITDLQRYLRQTEPYFILKLIS